MEALSLLTAARYLCFSVENDVLELPVRLVVIPTDEPLGQR